MGYKVFPTLSIPPWYAEGEASYIVNLLQATGDSVRFQTIPEFFSCRPRLSRAASAEPLARLCPLEYR
jgi:hypothetical protein